jgi:hypothetical protein
LDITEVLKRGEESMVIYGHKISVTDCIAFYAALISTITLVWGIANAILEKMARLRIRAGIFAQFVAIPGVTAGPASWVIGVTITNISIYDIYVMKPRIGLPKKYEGSNYISVFSMQDTTQYPVCIKSREQFQIYEDISGQFVGILNQCNANKTIRFRVEETTGKVFYSNKLKISRIIEMSRIR